MTNHLNDGTLAPQMADWLSRYTGDEPWIIELATRAAQGIAPMPRELRRLEDLKISATADGGWRVDAEDESPEPSDRKRQNCRPDHRQPFH